jgi:hypothetical protein
MSDYTTTQNYTALPLEVENLDANITWFLGYYALVASMGAQVDYVHPANTPVHVWPGPGATTPVWPAGCHAALPWSVQR